MSNVPIGSIVGPMHHPPSRRERLIAWTGLVATVLLILLMAAAVLAPLFAAAQVPAPPQDLRRYPGEVSGLALIGIRIAVTGMQVQGQRTELTLRVTNSANRAYLMVGMECTLHDESGTAIATITEYVWDLGPGQATSKTPAFWLPVGKPGSARCRAVEVQ